MWTHTGNYDVTVTDTWVVDDDVAGRFSGRIRGTLDAVTLPAFEVRRVQPVRVD